MIIFRIFIIFLIITLLMVVAAFFSTPEFSMPCSEQLVTCLGDAYHKSFGDKMMGGLGCVFSNLMCMGEQFKGIF